MEKENKFHKRLSDCRKKLKLTQRQFAEKLGCRKRTVENWLYGRRVPNSFVQKTLEKFLEKHGI